MSNEERNREIFALRECGMTYGQLSIQFKLSPARIKDICDKEKNKIKSEKLHNDAMNGKIPFTFLDALEEVCETESQMTRIFRCLNRAGIIEELDKNHGSLDSYSDETLLSIRHFGTISLIFARRANELYKQKRGLHDCSR